jgi:ribonuclease HI
MPRQLIIEADGGSRGNPGIAAGGAVVIDGETQQVLCTVGVFVGVATNNVAEYNGLVAGLSVAYDIDPDAFVHVRMDSKLVVEQMAGRWKIKHPDMATLAATARQIIGNRAVTYEWVPRLQNALADAAANKSMDAQASFST